MWRLVKGNVWRTAQGFRLSVGTASARWREGLCGLSLREAGGEIALLEEFVEGGGEFADGSEEEVGFGGTEAFFGRERAEDGDGGADSRTARHLEVFGRVADVDGFRGTKIHAAKG